MIAGWKMKFAYLTIDPVNLDVAERLAEERSVGLTHGTPKDAWPEGDVDAVIYDLDHWTGGGRELEAWVQEHARIAPQCPVAVHSYHLDDAQVETLERQGYLIARSLDQELVHRLVTLVEHTTEEIDEEPVATVELRIRICVEV